MEQNEILEGNKLIAEFMGITKSDLLPESFLINGNTRTSIELEYHTSLDLIVPVVEKICQYHNGLNYTFRQEVHDRKITPTGFVYSARFCGDKFKTNDIWATGQSFKSPIEATWIAIIEFIKWYNQNNKQ